jgi:hypothetical protein
MKLLLPFAESQVALRIIIFIPAIPLESNLSYFIIVWSRLTFVNTMCNFVSLWNTIFDILFQYETLNCRTFVFCLFLTHFF